MTRVLFTAAAMAALPPGSHAGEVLVRLNVRPMPAPKPALKYQLLPELGELNPGNAAQNYLKCFLEQRNFFWTKEAVANRDRYQTMPLAELPLEKLRDYGGSALRQADWAARLDTLDWQALPRIQDGGIGVLPGELGPLQVLAAALRVRFRAEVAGRRYDDAVRTAKTLFALSRHLADYPAEVASLVGLWVAHLGLGTLEEMVQQSGCPNLYWALTDLPDPLVDVRKAAQGDRIRVAGALRRLHDDAPMAEPELESFVSRLSAELSFVREQAGQAPRRPREGLRSRLLARCQDPERVRAARGRLVEAGCAQGLVQRFLPLQVILLDEKRDYEVERDERLKLLALPLWQIQSLAGIEDGNRGRDGLFADLLPHVVTLRRTQGELQRQIALLRHVEALRLYAAGHDGKLPGKLSEIPVPLPDDPFTGEPFAYHAEGATARLRGHAPASEDKNGGCTAGYVVTVQK